MLSRYGFFSLVFALTAISSCGTIDYPELPAAEFEGKLHVVWLGEGDPTSGDGLFVYVPDPVDPLRLRRSNSKASIKEIVPPMMYTDGGSIPRPATLFRGFSPWGYAPAYVIHDWLFVARHCLNDGNSAEIYEDYKYVTFQESAEVIGEAIKALVVQKRVSPNQVAPQIITGVVAGPISYELWTAKGECAGHQVPEDILERAKLGLPGTAVPASGRVAITLESGRTVQITPGNTVATFSF